MGAYNYSIDEFPEANQPLKRLSWPELIKICYYASLSTSTFLLNLLLYPFSGGKPTGWITSATAAGFRVFFNGIGTQGLLQKISHFQPMEHTFDILKNYKGKNNYNKRFDEAQNSISRWVYEKEGRTKDDPVMLFIHGGGFETKVDPDQIVHVRNICEKSGISGMMIDYGTIPWFRFPTQLDECLDSYMALSKSCDKIIIAGDSAGGTLACAVALKLKELTVPLWGFYAIAPWVELYPKNTGSWITNANLDMITGPLLQVAAEKYLDYGKYDHDKLAQPCLATAEDWKGAMPENSLVLYGKCELFADQCAKLVETAGVTDSFGEEGAIHCHNYIFDKDGPANQLVYSIISEWKGSQI